MKILITGDLGYIGSVLVPMLLKMEHTVSGFDTGYFSECILEKPNDNYKSVRKDIRNIVLSDVEGFDVVIHLAGLSNDPLGEFDPALTEDINFKGTLKLAQFAKQMGVSRFIYSSSQSMYGISSTDNELDEDDSEKNPVTAYAKTKWEAECRLNDLAGEKFTVTSFRPSTVFGASPRLRCDIVFNNLVACAYTTGKIEILSDGTPWRPVVHVQDVCSAFVAGLDAPPELISGRAFNVGIPNGNFTVRDLAEAAQRSVPGCELVFLNEHSDPRTYKVSFNRILNELKEYYHPKWDLDMGGKELVAFFDQINFKEEDFRGRTCNRLKQLEYLRRTHQLTSEIKWI
ncbi:MAG: NAD(P)-dependent oxidoreductase [Proteobacteria bacterium]|nr:NAD(P)-dependent oxidoreductase [Pseudomonadota bacterium]MBU1389461.1 NAD(P)-dependent oxidoreductase [Pseudomonadota bacterium]MBU1541281.1 NAD(P)-dependent oxidoreductase [Pseudomonadota bacterium]MBU2430160.1 NAD(P)-dependent oxidoreductase [Pseudomonadota bacterium]